MSRLALYREERPQSFAEVVGQQHVTRTLKNAMATGRLTHAYLFAGPRGTGKTSVARILARAINCLDRRDGEPCNACRACTLIQQGATLDIIEIDAASNRRIDDVRDLREKVRFAPTDLTYKVYIIDEVHMLTEEAFNALLKTLEEPPGHVVFILATTDPHKVPVTIRSRCQRYDFHRLSTADMVRRMRDICQRHGYAVTDEALAAIARQAEGGMRDALSLLDQLVAYAEPGRPVTLDDTLAVLGAAPVEVFHALAEAVATGDVAGALLVVDDAVRQGRDLRQFVRDFAGYLRDLLLAQVVPGGGLLDLPAAALAQVQEQARAFRQEQLLAALKLLAGLEAELRQATNPRLLVEVALIRLATGSLPAGAPLPTGEDRAQTQWDPDRADTRPGGEGGGTPQSVAPVPAPSGATPGAAVAQATPQATGPEIEAVRRVWPAVVDLFGSTAKSKPYQVFVQQAVPLRVEGNTLTLGFSATAEGRTARDMVEKRIKWVEEALRRHGLPTYRIVTVLMEEAPAPATGPVDYLALLKQRLGDVPIEVKEE